MTTRLYRVIHPVDDIEVATRFFSAIFGSEGERVSPGRHYFTCGETILACYNPVADGDEPGGPWQHHENQYLYFSVAELQAAREAVARAGGEIVEEIAQMPWGEVIFYARDPFGSPIAFVDETTVFTGA